MRFESLLSFGEAVKFVFEVTWRKSELAMAVGAANYMDTQPNQQLSWPISDSLDVLGLAAVS